MASPRRTTQCWKVVGKVPAVFYLDAALFFVTLYVLFYSSYAFRIIARSTFFENNNRLNTKFTFFFK